MFNNAYVGQVQSTISPTDIYGPQFGNQQVGRRVAAENPAPNAKFQPAVLGQGTFLSTFLGMVLFLVVVRVLYEVAK